MTTQTPLPTFSPLLAADRELLSALADGELGAHEASAAFEACKQDASTHGSWNTYHLIGDVMRTAPPAASAVIQGADVAFLERLNQRLKSEKIVQDRLPDVAPRAEQQDLAVAAHHRGPASNDGNFKWKLVAGFASLGAVASVAWSLSGLSAPASTPLLAEARQGTTVQQLVIASEQGPMVRDARLEELLAAHKQLGTTSLQAPSGFLRSASFETPPVGRR
jgi:sigma-E factor negative regulatory protein RseA